MVDLWLTLSAAVRHCRASLQKDLFVVKGRPSVKHIEVHLLIIWGAVQVGQGAHDASACVTSFVDEERGRLIRYLGLSKVSIYLM